MRVTFDTNTLADVVSPSTSQRADGEANGTKVRSALQAGVLQGYFCETVITLEGIKNADRSPVFGSTAINTTFRRGVAQDGNEIHYIDMQAEQSARRPLDQRQADRFLSAFALDMKLLGAPRTAMVRVDDPDNTRYVAEPDEEKLGQRLDRFYTAATAIEARGFGCAQAQAIADQIRTEIGGHEPFVSYLGKPLTQAEQRLVNRAIAEWSDGDSVAAHYGYGLDLFCTEDFGKGASKGSVLDEDNRSWLTEEFNIRFVTLSELATLVNL